MIEIFLSALEISVNEMSNQDLLINQVMDATRTDLLAPSTFGASLSSLWGVYWVVCKRHRRPAGPLDFERNASHSRLRGAERGWVGSL